MFKALPEPDPAVLARPPANLVVFNLAIEAERDLKPSDGVAWQKLLEENGLEAPLLQKVQQQTLTFAAGPGSRVAPPTAVDVRDGWKAVRRDQLSQAAVFANGCTVERLSYPGFDAFYTEMRAATVSLGALFTPSLRTRIGLRYSNALSSQEAKQASYWVGKVESSFLGVGADARLQDEVERTLAIADFREGDSAVQVRSGLQPDVVNTGCIAFAFDVEIFDGALTSFDVDACMERARDLNRIARQVFQAILTETYFRSLKETV
jgi:uncharacterized protein (TIGR04255 family)